MPKIVLFCLLAAAASAQTRTERISITDYRPLAKAMLELETRYGWLVPYEDPQYSFRGDLLDRTPVTSKHPEESYRTGCLDLVPVERTVAFEYEVSASTGLPVETPQAVIKKAVDAYTAVTGYTFTVTHRGERFFVTPDLVRDEKGQLVHRDSILDIAISIPETERDLYGSIKAISDALSEKTHRRFGFTGYNPNYFFSARMILGADKAPAREVVVSVLDKINPRYSWWLGWDPGCPFAFINLHVIADPMAVPPPPPRQPAVHSNCTPEHTCKAPGMK